MACNAVLRVPATGRTKLSVCAPMKRRFSSLAARSLLGQAAGLLLTTAVSLFILYFAIRAQIYDNVQSTGMAAIELLENVIKQDPTLMQDASSVEIGRLETAIDDFAADFSGFNRISVVNYHLSVIADTEKSHLGQITDQSSLIEVMRNPREDVSPLIYTRSSQRYLRLSQAIHGPFDPVRNTDVIGAVAMDMRLSDAEGRIRAIFNQAAGILVFLFAIQLGLQYLFLRTSVLTPVHGLIQAVKQIRQGQLSARAPVHAAGELGDVGSAFNAMAEEIERANTALSESSQTLRTIILSSPLAIIQLDMARNVKMWNPAAESIFGWSEAEALEHPLLTTPPDKQDESSAILASLDKGETVTNITTQRMRKDGSRVDVNISASPLRNLEGKIIGFSAIIADVSKLRQAENAMKESNDSLLISVAKLEQRTRELTLLGEMGDLLQACVKPEEAHLVVARATRKIFPNMPGALYEIPPSRDHMEPIISWGQSETTARVFAMDECWALRRGRTHRVEDSDASLICQHVADEGGNSFPYLCVPMVAQGEALGLLHLRCAAGSPAITQETEQLAETIAEQIALALSNLKLREALRQQSIRDTLTGLFNRRYLDETLIREIERAKRVNTPLSIIMIDLDHFKHFNDTYGHKAGDTALEMVGKFLETQVRIEDIACRYGGEEFTLILPGTDLETAQQRAEQLRTGIRTLKMSFEGQALEPLTLSLGVAVFPTHGGSGQAVLEAADAALYRAKQNGRDRFELAG
ncbi:MAG: diguanylate cyclase [Anaerolineales bacterium]